MEAVNAGRWPIFLHGAAGRGKSCAAACLYCRAGGMSLWYETHSLIRDILDCRMGNPTYVRGEGGWFEDDERSICLGIKAASLVVFDDIALRKPTAAAFEVFYELVNQRFGKPTIYTSNVTGAELVGVFDTRITSRLLSGTVIEVVGKDRRLERTKAVKVSG
jgi:DNA replication protein DnaC